MGSSTTPAGSVVSADVTDMVRDYLGDLARAAHRRLGDVAGVAVTMATEDEGLITAGASSEVAREVDAWQYQVGAGPCLAALEGRGGAYVADLGAATAWGEYGPGAAARGARSCLSIPVPSEDTVFGVFKVYSGQVDGIDESQRRIAALLAAEASGGIALAVRLSTVNAELQDRIAAMDSRRTIDLALGIIMQRAGRGPDEAFDLLRQYSQHSNVKVREMAARLVASAGSAGPEVSLLSASEAGPDADGGNRAPFRVRGHVS